MATQTISLLFAVALVCVAASASAQAVYRKVDDTGHILISDQPPVKPASIPRRGGMVEANEAARRLMQARLERSMGAAPRAGELTASTGNRTLNYRYWRRQEKLRQLVEQAQRRARETARRRLRRAEAIACVR